MDVKLLLCVWSFLCLGGFAVSQRPGTDFALVFMQNVLPRGGKPDLKLLLTSFFPDTKANIQLPRRYFKKVVSLTTGIPTSVELPNKFELFGSTRSDMTIRITSNKPISVVAINKRSYSTGVAVMSPVSDWGSEYYIMTPDSKRKGAVSQMAIVNGPKPNLISVLLKGSVQFENITYLPGEHLYLALGPWESVQLQSNQSLTTSRVVSQKDVAIFVGLGCAKGHRFCNHVYIQLPAITAWGSKFVVPLLPFPSLGKVTIISAIDTLVRLIDGNETTDVMVAPGKKQEFEVDPTTALLIGSLQKIMVLLHFEENDQLVAYNIPPMEKACVAYSIVSLPNFDNRVLLVVHKDAWEELELDHKPLLGLQWENSNATETVHASLPLSDNGFHFISNAGHDFVLTTIGIGKSSSYALPGICLDKEFLLCEFGCTDALCSNLRENTSSCITLAPPTCMMWGKMHLLTFYDSLMLVSQFCPHVLISSSGDGLSLLPFSVERQPSPGLTVQIRVLEQLLEISTEQRGVVFINNEKLYTPISVYDGSLNVTRFGLLATIVNVSFGLRVIIGDHGFLHLQIAQQYYESVSGDCVAQIPKEMLTSTGPKFLDLLPACESFIAEHQKLCDNTTFTADFSSCQMISESEIFQPCHLTLDPKPFIESCESEVCNGGSSCSAIESYALACGINGVHMIGWRNISNCGLQCSLHSHYESCSTTCQASCLETQIFNCDTSLCYEACLCDEGYELSAGSCIPKSECGCYWKGSYYPKGEFLGKDCKTRCICSGSKMDCHQIEGCDVGTMCEFNSGLWSCKPPRYVSCTLYGDSHYMAFDGQAYTFNGLCDSQMAGVCSNYPGLEDFEVHMVQEPVLGSIKAINITVYGKAIVFNPRYHGKVNVDGTLVQTPYVVGTSLQIYKSALGADVLQTDFGLVVSFDRMERLLIKVPNSYMGSVCGLCASMINQVSNESTCEEHCQGVCIKCSNETDLAEAIAYCGLIKDPVGAFRNCHLEVDPYPYIEACVSDVCSGSTWCQAFNAYAAACWEAGAEVGPWRLETDCGYNCTPNSTSMNSRTCAPGCPPTCEVTFPLTCVCQEGCQCDPGFILSGDRCVLPEDCGCYVDGRYWERDEVSYDDQCQNRCSCLDGGIACESYNCTLDEECTIVMGVRACYPLSFTCSVSEQYYHTFDGLSYPVNTSCPLVMAMVTSTEELVSFEVHLRRNLSDGGLLSDQNAILKIYGYTIILEMFNEGLKVNDNEEDFPVQLDNRIFGYLDGYKKVLETDFGLLLTFDSSIVSLKIPLAYAGRVRGLCGNANALASDDTDGLPITKLLSQWSSYAEHTICNWTLEDVSVSMTALEVIKYCELIMEAEGPFQECHGLLDPQGFYNSCLSTMNVNYVQAICQSIQHYSDKCQQAGATVHPWNNALCQAERPTDGASLAMSTSTPPTLSMPIAPATDVKCLPNVVPSACLFLHTTSCLFQSPRRFPNLDEVDLQSSPIECNLTLAEVCSNDQAIDSFSVSVHYDVLGNHSTESLHVEVYGLNIVLPWNWNNGVWVNKMPVSVPTCLIPGKLQIRNEGPSLILDAFLGLVIKYNHNGFILIQLPLGYQSDLCGQCAQKEPHETRVKFTSEMSKNDSGHQCLITVAKELWTSNEDHSSSASYCSMFRGDESPFRDCHRVINPHRFYDACNFHVCQELQSGGNGDYSACHDLEEYVTLCQFQNVTIQPWRNESFCPFACPPQVEYELCAKTCIRCQNENCSGPCQEGCNCIDGYLWNGIDCVASNACLESIYPVIPKYLNCDTNSPSQSDCRICRISYQHITTFGNISSPLEGNNVYDVLRKCNESAPEWLRVVLDLHSIQPAKLHIFYEQSFITINSTLEIWVNGELQLLPVSLDPELYISKAADVVVIGKPGAMDISFHSSGDLEIRVAESLSMGLCGACVFSLESWTADDLS